MTSLAILLQVTESVNKLKVDAVASQHLSFFELMLKGGVILIPIGILSLCAIYLIAEKYFVINQGTKIRAKVKADFKLYLKNGEIDKARAVLQKEKGAYPAIFSHCLNSLDYPVTEIEAEIESVSNVEVSKLNHNLSYLGLIAGIAPMLGFIGTISGIIKIFYNISVTDNISIGIIAGGLYEKMISSGSGLIVGVIAYSGYHVLNMKLDRFISSVEAEAFDVVNILKKRNK
jgi:biopolymer transport protein ExbB